MKKSSIAQVIAFVLIFAVLMVIATAVGYGLAVIGMGSGVTFAVTFIWSAAFYWSPLYDRIQDATASAVRPLLGREVDADA